VIDKYQQAGKIANSKLFKIRGAWSSDRKMCSRR
jgi:hypothetical protein